MKSIRTRIALSYIIMILCLWVIVGTVSISYVRTAIFQYSADSMHFLLEEKITVLNTAFSGIEQNVSRLNNFIASRNKHYDEKFYEELFEKSVLAFDDQKFVKTIYFCPNPNETDSSKCLYLLNTVNGSANHFRFTTDKDGDYINLTFDIAKRGKDSREHIPWFYAAEENKIPMWIGTYPGINAEDFAPMISYLSPVFSDGKFCGVVGVEITLLSLRSEIDSLDYGNSSGILVNPKGDFIYHKDFPSGLSSEEFCTDKDLSHLTKFLSAKYADSKTTYEYEWKDGMQVLILGMLKNGMLLALSVPKEQLISLQHQMFLQLAILFIVSLTIAISVIGIVTNKIVKPIEIINQSAHYIAHGELNTKIPVYSKDEFGMLASSIRKIEVELSEYIGHIRDMAYKDFMTGCRNKAAYLKHQSAIEMKIDEGMANFTVYVCDVNGLKHLNDTLGHEMGDALIKGAASALKIAFDEKTVFRTGGDEFVVVIEDEKEDVEAKIAAFNKAVADFNEENEFDFTLAVSIGAATFKNGIDKDFKSVAERADKAMYADKEEFYKQHEDLRRK
ncbi:diguanylate cyclase [uncultured Treponema sp.]|uniref:sensor domain-containing diguanylate cyclase n=1 Tax=uncultured Treponema sp. TaxID=162155 RepID=UPI0026015190|nr:diguanylate cyclase [uncultured Treponema sp.]